MKNLKMFAMILGCAAVMCLASCMDDEESGLTPEEVKTAYETVKGSYDGELYYVTTTADNKSDIDTLAIQWSIDSDSIMTIKNFPTKVLAANINDSIISEAVSAAEDQDIKCYIGFYSISPIKFLVNPTTTIYHVSCGEKKYKIQIAYYINSAYSFGIYSAAEKLMQIQIVEGAVYVNGQTENNLLDAQPSFILRTKINNK